MQTSPTLPAEWHAQDGILITWPHQNSAWADSLKQVTETYLELTAILSHHQAIYIQVHSCIDLSLLCAELARHDTNLSQCHFINADSNDTWARDHGPISVYENGQPKCLDFQFNGWGEKFEHNLDNNLNNRLHSAQVLKHMKSINWVLEGGSIESDGTGTLLTTAACVLNKNRNAQINAQDLSTKFSQWFGVQQVLFLQNGELEGDDTDAHIDTLARFTPNNTIVFQGCQDTSDIHFNSLNAMKAELENFKNVAGEAYRLLELPLPSAKYAQDGHRLPATYANFLITNELVIVPTYKDTNDVPVLNIIKQAFPEHQIIGINALPLIEEHGSIHCITMQLPKGVINKDAQYMKSDSLLG